MSNLRLARWVFCLISIGLSANSLHAANIVWGLPTNVAGNSDVTTTGTLVEAANTGIDQNSVPTTTTVNGVTFAGWIVAGGGVPVSPGDHFSLTAAPGYFHQSFNGFGSGSAPFSTLSSEYQAMLTGANYSQSQTNANDFTGALTFQMSGLTIGLPYIFQWWTNDSRPFSTGPVTATTDLTSVSLDPNTINGAGGTGQFVIGTFVADGTTQNVVFSTTGNANLQNAFQLRVVPEPSTLAILVSAFCTVAAYRRFRVRV